MVRRCPFRDEFSGDYLRIADHVAIISLLARDCATWVPREGSLRFSAFLKPSRCLSAYVDGQKKEEKDKILLRGEKKTK